MSDPTTPDPAAPTGSSPDLTTATDGTTAQPKPAPEDETTVPDEKTAAEKTGDESLPADGEKGEGGAGTEGVGGAGKTKWYRRLKVRRNPWLTVGGVVVILLALALAGYFWGLGPMNRLNTARGITPPAKLAGLDRITDEEIRGRLQLDQTREALSRINDGKQATVEAYGALDGSRIYVLIALRGKVDVDKTIKDSGATSDQVKEVGRSTCVESSGNLPTQCYRSSGTLTVIAQVANEGVGVDTVGPVADEAFNAMK